MVNSLYYLCINARNKGVNFHASPVDICVVFLFSSSFCTFSQYLFHLSQGFCDFQSFISNVLIALIQNVPYQGVEKLRYFLLFALHSLSHTSTTPHSFSLKLSSSCPSLPPSPSCCPPYCHHPLPFPSLRVSFPLPPAAILCPPQPRYLSATRPHTACGV